MKGGVKLKSRMKQKMRSCHSWIITRRWWIEWDKKKRGEETIVDDDEIYGMGGKCTTVIYWGEVN